MPPASDRRQGTCSSSWHVDAFLTFIGQPSRLLVRDRQRDLEPVCPELQDGGFHLTPEQLTRSGFYAFLGWRMLRALPLEVIGPPHLSLLSTRQWPCEASQAHVTPGSCNPWQPLQKWSAASQPWANVHGPARTASKVLLRYCQLRPCPEPSGYFFRLRQCASSIPSPSPVIPDSRWPGLHAQRLGALPLSKRCSHC